MRTRNGELLARFYEHLFPQPDVSGHQEFSQVADRLWESTSLWDLLASSDANLGCLGQFSLYLRAVAFLPGSEPGRDPSLFIAVADKATCQSSAKISGLLTSEEEKTTGSIEEPGAGAQETTVNKEKKSELLSTESGDEWSEDRTNSESDENQWTRTLDGLTRATRTANAFIHCGPMS
jgi:hypothetical protein